MTINELCNIYKELDKDAKSGKRNGALQRFVGVRGPALNYYNI